MPGPGPDTLWIDDTEPQRLRVTFTNDLWAGNGGNRQASVIAILMRLRRRDWFCRWRGDPLQDHRRANAKYCREGCRKRAARRRKGPTC